MNRRNFIRNLLVGGASFAILPGAGRLWAATRQIPTEIVSPTYKFDPLDYAGEWSFTTDAEVDFVLHGAESRHYAKFRNWP